MIVVNEVDLYLIRQYYKTNYQFVNYLYELNQRSFDIFYKLKAQKIKQLPEPDFKFKRITKRQIKNALQKIGNNILKDALQTWYDYNCIKRLLKLKV